MKAFLIFGLGAAFLASGVVAGDCTYIEVQSGDSCKTLVEKCKISPAEFNAYNPANDLCATLTPGQAVCCSAGTVPDRSPKPNADGSCAKYTIASGDSCSSIAQKFHLSGWSKIDEYNKGTPGFRGCEKAIFIDETICVSSGTF